MAEEVRSASSRARNALNNEAFSRRVWSINLTGISGYSFCKTMVLVKRETDQKMAE